MSSKHVFALTFCFLFVSVGMCAAQEHQPLSQLDQGRKAEIKVFTLENRDAGKVAALLEELFGQAGSLVGQEESLSVSADARTNSIICSGWPGDLIVIENLVGRIDRVDVERSLKVFKLNNSPAVDVAAAINGWFDQKAELFGHGDQQEVSIVAEVVSNSLIVASSLQQDAQLDLEKMIAGLDERPEMVKLKVLVTKTVDGEAKVISRPHLVTLNENESVIKVQTTDGELSIQITPYIIKDETIRADQKGDVKDMYDAPSLPRR